MSNALLREYLSLVLQERIKTGRGPTDSKGKRPKGHFDLRFFKSIDNINMLTGYAGRYLQKLGEGSSRTAFTLTNRTVLKIALNAKGIAQNKTELDVYTNPATKDVIARITDADEKGYWVISELVKQLKTEDEFERLTGIKFNDMATAVVSAYKNELLPDHLRGDDFIHAIITTMKEASLLPGDLGKIDSWGQTPDGRAVLLDYGFTHEVWSMHYKNQFGGKTAGSDQLTRNANVKITSAKTRPEKTSAEDQTRKLTRRAERSRTLKAR